MATSPYKTIRSQLGRLGVWAMQLRQGDPGEIAETAAELDHLGYRGLWFPGGVGGDILANIDRLLEATPNAVIATGILNVWKHEPAEVGAWWRGLTESRQQRVLLGIGASHGPLIGADYVHPLAKVRSFLDGTDKEGVDRNRICIAALRPKMLELAASRTIGSHPYLTTPEHTRYARETMGADPLLAPELGVVLEADPTIARDVARKALSRYLALPNYTGNWKKFGFSDEEVTGLSDRLVDAVIAWGDIDAVVEKVDAHHAEGADHVCVQVLAGEGGASDLATLRKAWREIAHAFF